MLQDIEEKGLSEINVAKVVRCLDANGDSKVITPANLLSTCIQDLGIIPNGEDLNKYHYGLYHLYPEYGTVLNGPSFVRFILICFRSGGHIAQIAIDVHPQSYQIQYRTSYNGGTYWDSWKTLAFT